MRYKQFAALIAPLPRPPRLMDIRRDLRYGMTVWLKPLRGKKRKPYLFQGYIRNWTAGDYSHVRLSLPGSSRCNHYPIDRVELTQ